MVVCVKPRNEGFNQIGTQEVGKKPLKRADLMSIKGKSSKPAKSGFVMQLTLIRFVKATRV